MGLSIAEVYLSPVSHLLISWCVASASGANRRDAALITVAGVAADIDGFGVFKALMNPNQPEALDTWSTYHHTFGHNLLFGVLMVSVLLIFAHRKRLFVATSLISFHMHLLCDLLGAKGPDGYQWPIPYLWPFADSLQLTWSGQWALNAWPNFLITAIAVAATGFFAWKRGYSLVGYVSPRADNALVMALRQRFGVPG